MTRWANIVDRRLKRGLAHRCGRALRWAFLLVGAMVAGCGAERAVAQSPTESQVKAAFLVNFPKYVGWPEAVFARADSPMVIATLGETSLSDELRKMVSGKALAGHPMTFKVLAESDDFGDCHILFIPDSARRRVPLLLKKLEGSNVLTVGESDDFLEKGGMINLQRRDRKIRLQVNLEAARPAGLKISSKLLSLADVVKGK